MANRRFQQFQGTLLKGVVRLHARVSVAGAGAVTLQSWNVNTKAYATAASTGNTGGIKSVTRTGTGLWTVVLQDPYVRLLGASFTTSNTTGAATVTAMAVDSDGDLTSNSAPTILLVFSSATVTAADPASGDKIDLIFELSNSNTL